ncbi:hypothetical protein LSH36_298g03012 [Paralvinella palmiformis]|uniref:Uncharacterized protein n=1 Tax=Paralvinella palmiformis TaxID=53620 RepID=A0AAD9JHR4_9ANNE|nr:hypothetical protein LSH36_298g03012 [Paralvinella palmiformis]
MIRELSIFFLILDVVSAECYYLEVEHAYNYEVNGVYYIYDYDLDCEGRNIYRHIDRELYLYHIDGWWVVHHQYCTEEGVIYGLVRGHDSSWTPELIIEIWEEHVSGHWNVNLLFDVDCYYGPSALPTIAVICISIACFLVAVAIIALPIVLCLRHGETSRSNTPEPAPSQPDNVTFVELTSVSPDQPPPYEPPPSESVLLSAGGMKS